MSQCVISKYLIPGDSVELVFRVLPAEFRVGTEDIAIERGGVEHTYVYISRRYPSGGPDAERDHQAEVERRLRDAQVPFVLLES